MLLSFNVDALINSQQNNEKQNSYTIPKVQNETKETIKNELEDTFDKDDEKLIEEILQILSSTYKSAVDIAALYFCGFSVDQNKLFDQIIVNISKDIFNIIKLFAWYVPVMLKNPKLKTKEKLKKASYVVGSTIVLWCICSELLSKKVKPEINRSIELTRSLVDKSYQSEDFFKTKSIQEEDLKPRRRPK